MIVMIGNFCAKILKSKSAKRSSRHSLLYTELFHAKLDPSALGARLFINIHCYYDLLNLLLMFLFCFIFYK